MAIADLATFVVAEASSAPRSAVAVADFFALACADASSPPRSAEAEAKCLTLDVAVADSAPSVDVPVAVVKNSAPSRRPLPSRTLVSRMNGGLNPSSPNAASFSVLVSSRNLFTAIAAY